MKQDHQDKAVAFLNANFEPWTFDGSEPVSEKLTVLLREVAYEAVQDAVAHGLFGYQTPPLGCKIESA